MKRLEQTHCIALGCVRTIISENFIKIIVKGILCVSPLTIKCFECMDMQIVMLQFYPAV